MRLPDFISRCCEPGVSHVDDILTVYRLAAGRNDLGAMRIELANRSLLLDRHHVALKLARPAEILRRFRQIFWREPHRTVDDVMKWSGAPLSYRPEIVEAWN
jgi:hypothetical protein